MSFDALDKRASANYHLIEANATPSSPPCDMEIHQEDNQFDYLNSPPPYTHITTHRQRTHSMEANDAADNHELAVLIPPGHLAQNSSTSNSSPSNSSSSTFSSSGFSISGFSISIPDLGVKWFFNKVFETVKEFFETMRTVALVGGVICGVICGVIILVSILAILERLADSEAFRAWVTGLFLSSHDPAPLPPQQNTSLPNNSIDIKKCLVGWI